MQPHSMCVVALAGFIWNRPERVNLKKAQLCVTYRDRYGEYKNNVYETEIYSRSEDDRVMKVYVIRGGGGISCTITVMRNSVEEGSEVVFTEHSQHHISGLREVFRLYKKQIRNGENQGSLAYRRFEGEMLDDTRRKIGMWCEVKNGNDVYVPVYYEVEIRYFS